MTMVLRPGLRFVVSHPAHFVAFGFGVGLAPVAPGTFGTLLAFPAWWLLAGRYPPAVLGACVVLSFALGVWACGLTGRHLGVADHGAMVWDELVAFLAVLLVVPAQPAWQAAAFVLFRMFDILKPPPIRQFERRYKRGFGVMFDDVLAAGYTVLVLAVAMRFFG
ncbi:MAG TPA: phosphatidylglycerophosphatase A [Burkholderiales bacterium]|nr:phosphatidylglycerophosphatase A [Burkholderiales bacterium]